MPLFHTLRDDPRAIAGIIGLTVVALREVTAQQGPAGAPARQLE
ncbi:hypothetical protein [Streptomyces sp. NPDC001889]